MPWPRPCGSPHTFCMQRETQAETIVRDVSEFVATPFTVTTTS